MVALTASSAPADAAGDLVFPMPVDRFLANAERLLMRSDIVLSRSPTLSSWLIRFGIGGFFSHAALVFLVPKPREEFESTFVLESVSSGVGLANLRDYIDRRRGHSDLVVLRLDAPWMDDRLRSQVRGVMLDHVKARYDYASALRLALSFLFGLRLGYSRITKGKTRSMSEAVARTDTSRNRWLPPQFICSGFVQYGFAEAMRRNGLPIGGVIFRKGLASATRAELLAVTPEDIATSDKVTWLYAVRRGRVYRVDSYAAAKAVISSARP